MHFYKSSTLSSDLPRNNQNYLYRTVGKELNSKYISKESSRDTTSSKLDIKGPRIADALHKTEVGFLRKQIQAFPEGLRENARTNYLLQQNNKRKELQEFQCIMLAKFETILRQKLIEQGLNYRRFKIGGTDRGTYEKFFKVSPARYMSKSQLSTALRLTFGDSMIKSAAEVNLLFDSFDYNRTDEMDWRSFLYLVLIVMQPRYSLSEHLKWGYAIYSSIGSLDLDCSEKLSLGMIKDMICTPILLSQRSQVRNEFDRAWMHLSSTDLECMQVAVKGKSSSSNDPDDMKISYKIFRRIVTETSFADFFSISLPFGKKDVRQWTAVLEEDLYHVVILKKLKELRREDRNESEADKFIALSHRRRKVVAFQYILEVKKKRDLLRLVLIGCEIRNLIQTCGKYFDRWKRIVIQLYGLQIVQRMVRGFLARRRKRFIIKLKSKTVKLQSTTRQLLTKLKYRKKHYKYYWAAVTIQRVYRGRISRLKVATSLEAAYDEGKRLLAKEKEKWLMSRKVKACIAIQTMIRKFLRRRKTMRRLENLERVERTKFNMELMQKKGTLAKNVFQQQLSKWYLDRKEENDKDLLTEGATKQQKKAIIDRRNKLAAEERARQKAFQEAKIEKMEEEQIEMWIKNWEFKIQQRAWNRRTKCNNCLILPETPEDVILKKHLLKKAQLAIKEVLRRADKQKIPMEIPEAREIAQKEVVDKEVEAELDRARQEMREEAKKIQKEKEMKAELKNQSEILAKKRRKKWALVTLQSYMRVFLARKILRSRAYQRFKKHFDVDKHEYFYEDTRSGETFWTKPKCVGSYDIPMENSWVVMHRKEGYRYYYNPSKWTQVWDLPEGCTLCENCNDYFAVALLIFDNICYCEHCLYKMAQKMIDDGYDAMSITFKEFDGNKTTSVLTDFRYIEESNWFKYIMNIGSYSKMSKEEEEFEKKKLLRRQDSIVKKMERNCNTCESEVATLSCIQCEKQFCQLCFSVEHESEEMMIHQATTIEDIVLPPIDSHKSKKDKSSKKKKSKKSSRNKAQSDVFSSGDETTNTNGEKKKKKKKKKKKSKKDSDISDSQDEKSIK